MEMPLPITASIHIAAPLSCRTPLINPRSLNYHNCWARLRHNHTYVRVDPSSDVCRKSADHGLSVAASVNNDCQDASLNGEEMGNMLHRSIWEETDFVEVIGIGSRKNTIIDFCLSSSSCSPALRFWNILVEDSGKVLLHQRCLTEDIIAEVVEVPSSLSLCSKAIILVANAAYGGDNVLSLDILRRVRYADGLVIGIILKPFCFEGRRRQDEMNELVDELQKQANFCIVIDTDALLAKELLTLDEALKTSNKAVLMAVNAISALVSDSFTRYQNLPNNCSELLKVPQLSNILEGYREAKIGYGVGYDIKTSILRAAYECPFLGVSLQESDGVILCVIASSSALDSHDVNIICQTFRQTTGWRRELVISVIHEANMDANLILTTLIVCGCIVQQPSYRNSLLFRLAQHFPFISNFFKKPDPHSAEMPYMDSMDGMRPVQCKAEDVPFSGKELQELSHITGEEKFLSMGCESGPVQSKIAFSATDFSVIDDVINTEGGVPTFRRELLTRQNLHPGFEIRQGGVKEGTDDLETYESDVSRTFRLPVGVKQLEQSKNGSTASNSLNWTEWMTDEIKRAKTPDDKGRIPWYRMNPDSESMLVVDNHATIVTQGDQNNFSKNKGVLSVRAASMLESERDTQKKWIPVVELKYRGGIYRGRIQGGLPEGKGRLSLRDGSVYDGMWRYGRRSGLGTMYFSNGNIYRGSWRDDLMHGKGWVYFHTGDRWFVDFWKGKANGEGRFYCKNGDVSFGHFKDGWRHGQFLNLIIDGTRCLEIWDEGVLTSREVLDSDDMAAG
ncbi:unnamed protein product [Cuscuta epithymum]|uniref:Protein ACCUMULATION AND REPLICATION OF CHLOROPLASTS 3 n=1 Tax=Cuscuta epithymum TaxID=186058 RepID=A0AAV0FFI7_9ASTE|nr:unnamed protein product [Cuscuta epithymum]